MTMRLDIVTNEAGELVRREHARDLGANVVIAIYRVAKLAKLHELTNQAFTRQLAQTHQAIVEYGLRAGMNLNILFAERAVFVAGQLLKGSRGTYENASELGEMLEWCGGQELIVQRDVTEKELHVFAEELSQALKSEKGRGMTLSSQKIRLRAVADAARLRGLELETLTDEQRIVRNYASAVVIMRRFFEDLDKSRYVLPRRIKRVAQNLVDLSAGTTPAFLGVTEVRNQNHDDAGKAVNTAILAVTLARELTQDRVALAQIAMAAMMHDVGRPRAAALGGGGSQRISGIVAKLSEEAEDKLASGTAAVLTALGRVNEPTITRTVIAFEALWLRRQQWLGPLYRGVRPPTLQSKILALARRYNDLLTPEPGLDPPTSDVAVATLGEELKDPMDRTLLRMLVAALGLFPIGTVVQLTTGEVAEVVSSPGARAPDRPKVRLVMDERGGMFDRELEVDLLADASRRIVKVVNVDGWKKALTPVSPSNGGGDSQFPRNESPSASVPSIASIKSISRAAREAPSNPGTGSGVVEISRGSYPSAGTSPSMVAEAMGRVMAAGEFPETDVDLGEQRTVMAASPLEELERMRAETHRVRAARASGSPAPADSIRVPKDRAPTARGTLASTPLVHALVYMFDHSMSGSVLLREPDGVQHALYFQEGKPAKARSGRPMARLGEVLVEANLIDGNVIDRAVEASQRLGTLFGEYLVGENILPRQDLVPALAAQIARKTGALVNLAPDTDYVFFAELDLLENWAGGECTPCPPLDAILSAVRAWHDRARIRATLGRIARQALVVHPQADLSTMALLPEERAVIEAITSARTTLDTLYQQQVAEEETVSSVVYTLAVTRSFTLTASKGPPMGVAKETPSAAPQIDVRRVPDPMTGSIIPPSIQPPPPSARSREPARTWRPPVTAAAASEPAAMSSASAPPPPDAEMDEAERALQAMTDFRLAETAMQRNDLPNAERLAAKAVEGEKTNGEYIALLAWVRAMGGKGSVDESLSKLTDVLRDDALCERALLYRGKLLKREKRYTEALRDFQTVLDVNPRNGEAASEARLLRMQKKKR